jgi:hypothetical protein
METNQNRDLGPKPSNGAGGGAVADSGTQRTDLMAVPEMPGFPPVPGMPTVLSTPGVPSLPSGSPTPLPIPGPSGGVPTCGCGHNAAVIDMVSAVAATANSAITAITEIARLHRPY